MLASKCKQSARSSRAPIASASCQRLRTEHVFRSYSSATQKAEAPASAMAMRPPPAHQVQYSPITDDSLNAFLRKRAQEPITILPVPLPSDVTTSSPLHDYYYSDNRSQHLLAIMDTCLNDCYDVPRAREIFEATRTNAKLRHLLKVGMFNKFLQSYGMMAMEHERHRVDWLKEAWMLFDRMEQNKENIAPNAETYIMMLLLLMRFESISSLVNARNAHDLVELIRARNISLPSLLPYCSMVTTNEEEQDELVRYISRAIAAMGLPKLVHEFTRAVYDVEGAVAGARAATALPEVRPVMRLRPRGDVELEVKITKDGRYEEIQPVGDVKEEVYEVPYNLRQLRQSLQRMTTAHRTLGDNLFARQQILEQSAYDVAVERLKHEHEQLEKLQGNARLHGRPLRALMWDWHQKLWVRLEEDIRVLVQEEAESANLSPENFQLGSFLSLLDPEKLSLIVILDVLNLYGSQAQETSIKLTRALLSVGKAVEDEYKAETSRRYGIPIASYTQGLSPRGSVFSPAGYEVLLARRKAARQELQAAESFRAPWPQQVRLKVGSILVDCLMDVATVRRYAKDKMTGEEIFEDQPALHHGYDFVRGHKLGVIKVNPAVADRISRDNVHGTIHPRHLPMLTLPRPWLAIEDGGYLTSKTPVMRYKESLEQAIYLREASDQGRLEMIYSGLDVLGSTPWKINEDIFGVVLKVWNSGERFLKLPPAVYDGPEPQLPPGMENDARAKATYSGQLREWNQEKANCHSQRCSVNYKLEIARSVLGEKIYFPHNIDFRGRAYPVPPHFNHIGDDLSRGLLMFGEAKPLGVAGLRWLKIHISNLYGFDKASLSERAEFTMSQLDDVYDSAEKPLEGRRWWMGADDPWQCLAACMVLRAALESPDPSAFESCLPVHQDGTCNGLQHYAALGGDKHGAAQVNLDVTERPSDVYTYVARMLDARVDKDAAEGHELAKLIQGRITRKVVKQTVMTTVYGVTFVGARDQIEKQLRERTEVPSEMRFRVSSYVAKQTLAAIGDLFIGAKAIQTWFSLTARLIAKSIPADRVAHAIAAPRRKSSDKVSGVPPDRIGREQMTSVVWTTILGLPVVQPYRKVKRRQVMTKQQSVYISDPNSPTEVDPMKQASAFPPNFVHSLDASHMMLTALACRSAGITFAAVHDSYWTHAADVTQMSEYIRETFVELHSSEVLPRLNDEFRLRYGDHKVPAKAFLGNSFLQQLRDAGANIVLPDHVEKALKLGRRGVKKQTKKATDEEAKEEDQEMDEEEVQGAGGLKNVFLDLVDLIPPLPGKGDFEVANVRNSPYFFS